MKILCTKLAEQEAEWLLVSMGNRAWLKGVCSGSCDRTGSVRGSSEMKTHTGAECLVPRFYHHGKRCRNWKCRLAKRRITNTAMVKGNAISELERKVKAWRQTAQWRINTKQHLRAESLLSPLSGCFSPLATNLMLILISRLLCVQALFFLLYFPSASSHKCTWKTTLRFKWKGITKARKHNVLQFLTGAASKYAQTSERQNRKINDL